MIRPLHTLFLIADAGRARWVSHNENSQHDFKTIEETHAKPLAKEHPTGVVFQGVSGRRANVNERDEAVRRHHEGFARGLAHEVDRKLEGQGVERLVIVAPAHTLAVLTEHLSPIARAKLAGSLDKDLTKTPDHELAHWLQAFER